MYPGRSSGGWAGCCAAARHLLLHRSRPCRGSSRPSAPRPSRPCPPCAWPPCSRLRRPSWRCGKAGSPDGAGGRCSLFQRGPAAGPAPRGRGRDGPAGAASWPQGLRPCCGACQSRPRCWPSLADARSATATRRPRVPRPRSHLQERPSCGPVRSLRGGRRERRTAGQPSRPRRSRGSRRQRSAAPPRRRPGRRRSTPRRCRCAWPRSPLPRGRR